MQPNYYILKTAGNSLVATDNRIATHVLSPLNPLYFIILSPRLGLFIDAANLAVFLSGACSYAPFALAHDSVQGVAHFAWHFRDGKGRAYFRHYSLKKYLAALPLEESGFGWLEWRESLTAECMFSLEEQKTAEGMAALRCALLEMLHIGTSGKLPWNLKILLSDLALNYLNLAHIGRDNLDDQNWLAALRAIYKHHPLLSLEWRKDKQNIYSVPADQDFLDNLNRPRLNTAPVLINMLSRKLHAPSKSCCVVAAARNEGIYLLEFIAWYKALGVDAIFIYSNDNMDGSDAMLRLLAEKGHIAYIDNEIKDANPQAKHYSHAFSVNTDILDYEYAIVCDPDEFLYLNPDRFSCINDFLAMHRSLGADQISINWQVMRSGKNISYHDELLIDRFPNGHVYGVVKSIVRPHLTYSTFPHYAFRTDKFPFSAFHANGTFYESPTNDPTYSSTVAGEHAVFLHFWLKSWEEFIVKMGRNAGNFKKVKRIDFSRLTPNLLRTFINQFDAPVPGGTLKHTAIAAACRLEMTKMLRDPVIRLCNNLLQEKYKLLSKEYRREFQNYLESMPELRKLAYNFMESRMPANNFFE